MLGRIVEERKNEQRRGRAIYAEVIVSGEAVGNIGSVDVVTSAMYGCVTWCSGQATDVSQPGKRAGGRSGFPSRASLVHGLSRALENCRVSDESLRLASSPKHRLRFCC